MNDQNQPSTLNDPNAVRPVEPAFAWPEGELPAQMGDFSDLMPGIDNFRLPVNLAQCWAEPIVVKIDRPGHPEHGQTQTHIRLKFDRNAPLVIVDGPRKDETLTAQFSSVPRPRGRRDNPATAWVSDLAYMLELCLLDKSRPSNFAGIKAAYAKHAGKIIRIEHGIGGQCRKDKVRYIEVEVPGSQPDASGQRPVQVIEDPTGTKGCGKRYYTKDFKVPEGELKPGEEPYDTQIPCTGTAADGTPCLALVRGFAQVDRLLPPMGGVVQQAPAAPQQPK